MNRLIQPWREGETPTITALCSCCGYEFRSFEIAMHLAEAHLGSREMELQHLRDGSRLLVTGVELDSLDAPEDQDAIEEQLEAYEEELARWLIAETSRQKTVRGDGTFHASGVLP